MWCANQQPYKYKDDWTESGALLCNCEDKVAVAQNRSVVIHDKISFHGILTLNFESEINAVAWSDDSVGRFLLVAEHSGLLHTIHSKSQRVINSERIYQTRNDVDKTIQQLLFLEESNSLFLLGSGQLHCFTNMDYCSLDKALCEGSMVKAKTLREKITHTSTAVSSTTISMIADVYGEDISVHLLGDVSCLLTGLDHLDGSWSVERETTLSGYGNLLSGFTVSPQYLLTLTDKGSLILWNTLTYTAVRIWSDHKLEKIGRLTPVSNRISECRIVVYGQLYSRDASVLAILTLPKLEVIYSQSASSVSLAADYTGQLSIPYICGDKSTGTQLTSIALISAQARCEMMVSKQLYSEALSFAKSHQLDLQIVYEAWALSLAITLTHHSQSIATFTSCLDKLTDVHRVVDICLSSVSTSGRAADTSSLKQIIDSVLRYALRRLDVAEHAKCVCDRMITVLNALHRFGTFTTVCGTEGLTLDVWYTFLTCALPQEVLRLAHSQSPSAAMVIWSRHKSEIQGCMTVEWLDKLLECISPSLDCDAVCRWLSEHMVPVVDRLQQVSYSELLAKHMERLVRDYELSDRDSWPANSLALCSLLDNFKSALLSPSLTRLVLLRDNLKAIQQLKDVYRCFLSYSQYCEQTSESIVHRLLDVVAVPSMFRHHYETVAGPYMAQHCIHADKNLLLYVQDMISRYKYQRGYDSAGLLWEQKAVEVVACINMGSYKVRATVELAKHCASPWSKCIAELVDSMCLLHTEDVQELEVIRKKSILSHLLSSYDIPKEVVPNRCNVQMILKYILKNSGASPSGLTHALQVGEALKVEDHTVYLLACQTRLRNAENVTDILHAVPENIAKQVKTRIVSQCVELFNQTTLIDWDMKFNWAETSIGILTTHPHHVDERYFYVSLNELCSQLRALLLLKREYKVEITLKALDTPEDKLAHLQTLLKSVILCSTSDNDADLATSAVKSIADSMWSLERFSTLCSIPKRELYQSIYTESCGITPKASVGILLLIAERDVSADTVKFISERLRELVLREQCNVSNARELLTLAQTSATHCDSDDLLDICTLLNVLRCHHDVMSNCLGGDDQQDVTSEADKAELHTLFSRKCHKETDLLVNTSLVNERTSCWSRAVLTLCSGSEDSAGRYMGEFDKYHQLLKSNNHDLLSHRISLLLYFSSTYLPTTQTTTQLTNYLSSQLKTSISSLLPRLLSHRNLDVHLTLAALLDLPPAASLSLAKKTAASFGSQFLRTMSLANMAIVICHGYKQTCYLDKCILLKQEAIWGHILSKYAVNYLSVFGTATKSKLLDQIACKCPSDVVDRFIRDFSLGCDVERTYLKKIEIVMAKHCQTEFWTDTKEGAALLKEVATLLARVPREKNLIDSLVEGCNPYNYSLIHTLQYACYDSNSKKQQLLDFLNLYKRIGTPSNWEINYWKNMFADKGDTAIPSVSSSRLPFQPLVKGYIWKVLCAELSARTFEVLQPIASLLAIKTDTYLLNVALQIAESHLGGLPQKSSANVVATNWSTDDKVDSKFVQDIVSVLAAIQNKKSAVMCSQALVEKIPNSTERVLVSQVCARLARNWRDTTDEGSEDYLKADDVLRRVTAMHTKLSVEQCLYQHGIASDFFFTLIPHPTQLIQAILETTQDDSSHRAGEKFEACCHIASATGLDIGKVCYDIISDSWLSVGEDRSHVDMDMTMTLDVGMMMAAAVDTSTNESSDNNSDKEKWIVHLANSSIGLKIIHLLNSVLTKNSTPNRTKLLVIRCLLLLGDPSLLTNEDTLYNYIQLTNEQLTKQYKTVQYIDRLQSLNINMTVDEFDSCDMSALLVRLRKNFSSNPQAVELCADLCLEIGSYDVSMWKSLLQQMIQLNLVDKLADVLTNTASQTQLWKLDVYKQAWQLIYDKSDVKSSAGNVLPRTASKERQVQSARQVPPKTTPETPPTQQPMPHNTIQDFIFGNQDLFQTDSD